LTRRDRQVEARELRRPWEPGKSFDHSAPCGPVRRLQAIALHSGTELRLMVNGTLRQRSSLDLMIWNVPEIIARLSSQYVLLPGDLIFTGTPNGVGPLAPGDEVRAECDGLPSLTCTIGEPA
jgi:fumarylpyruvate hydrolase